MPGADVREAVRILDRTDRLLVLTGAGISAESGIPTFRGKDGLWRSHRPEDLATPSAFERDPKTVWEWYDWRRGLIAAASPNPGHQVIARLEEIIPDFLLSTQNVDGLHRRAGSRRLQEIHGSIWTVRCTTCGWTAEDRRVPIQPLPPACPEDSCGGLLRPGVVWFGEELPPDVIRSVFRAAESCQTVLVVGTSAVVQPAATLPLVARDHGAAIIEVNPEPTPLSEVADTVLRGPSGDLLPLVWSQLARAQGRPADEAHVQDP